MLNKAIISNYVSDSSTTNYHQNALKLLNFFRLPPYISIYPIFLHILPDCLTPHQPPAAESPLFSSAPRGTCSQLVVLLPGRDCGTQDYLGVVGAVVGAAARQLCHSRRIRAVCRHCCWTAGGCGCTRVGAMAPQQSGTCVRCVRLLTQPILLRLLPEFLLLGSGGLLLGLRAFGERMICWICARWT